MCVVGYTEHMTLSSTTLGVIMLSPNHKLCTHALYHYLIFWYIYIEYFHIESSMVINFIKKKNKKKKKKKIKKKKITINIVFGLVMWVTIEWIQKCPFFILLTSLI